MQICICDAVRRKGVWGDGCGALEGMLKHTPSMAAANPSFWKGAMHSYASSSSASRGKSEAGIAFAYISGAVTAQIVVGESPRCCAWQDSLRCIVRSSRAR